ncbi:TylF/MycF/NovP-related O-methyltransferase [Aminobacter anthyllidis]|uniref:class I SAM-dependent methyltransferase n=1 Tax=Aminobacter anthyllidis TaxID=1035067 RepID=UPI00245407EC|nr:TylF/MycF/NovP-related O-methyltransferase [Aminobacter anthyllidis]MDH4984423.1 TylF/MycF/NovP-related O-methyltransferase [Aminobacter anthyllidis]
MKQNAAFSPEFLEIWERVKPYTMTSPERGHALWSAVNTLVDNDIPGAIVECGVWRGGSAMLAALTLIQRGAANRNLILFDTFAGMTEPGPDDIDIHGRPADALMQGAHGETLAGLVQAVAPLDEVHAAVASTGYDMRLVRFVAGDVRETLAKTHTLRIALLRLDTDFYDSTMAELRHLYPRLTRGGVMIIDDYGHWSGARKAVEDYFADPDTLFSRPMLWVIDYTGRGAVKTEDEAELELDRYDYIPLGMSPPTLSHLFPYAKPGNPWAVGWPYLRREVPHVWRSDERHTGYVTGNASVEEAACLHDFASQFSGQRGLEIGTHYGWTAAHLLAAGLHLDCIDPAMQDTQREQDIVEVLDKVPGSNGYKLWHGYSPQCIEEVRASAPEPWSFVFIDGNHDGDAPRDDARAVLPHLAADAMVMFHDLISPHVEAGLAVFREAGFQTRLINTMQVLGVAWRGNVRPPQHVQDPNVPNLFAAHLDKYLP